MKSNTRSFIIVFTIFVIVGGGYFLLGRGEQFELPKGETVPLSEITEQTASELEIIEKKEDITASGFEDTTGPKEEVIISSDNNAQLMQQSTREIFVTDNVKHSIPLNEILSGGPPKDGIPSIDNPKFITTSEADGFLTSDSVGLGIDFKGETRFYPYQILVWHEIVNDTVAGEPILITYCPLCATGITFERKLDGETVEFGTSGKLWQSNLLMYNRSINDNEADESLWSQVLGEAVLGELTGTRLAIIPSDTVLYGDWKKQHKDTKVLSKDTGIARSYGRDPYGDYYTNNSVSFGATFNDDRLHPKAYVLGIEIDGEYKAYDPSSLPSSLTDTFAGKSIEIEKDSIGRVRFFTSGDGSSRLEIPVVGGFWFSWLAVHPDTQLYK